MSMIEVENLTKEFGETTAVEQLSFHVDEGEIFGFLGPNGAGKTTTMRMLCCLISKTSGVARIAGYDTDSDADSLKIRKIIGLVPDDVGLYDELSALENLDFYGKLYECGEQQRRESIEKYLRMMGLWEKKDQPVGGFSKGMRQKVALARALVHDPTLLFFDEPTANLDPEAAKAVRNLILDLKQRGKTIFLNTHDLDEAQRICDRIAIINTKLLAVNTPEQLKKSAWGRKTAIQLESINDAILAAVKKLKPQNLVVEGNRIIMDAADPKKEIPDYVKALVEAGAKVQLISERSPDLEEAYLKIVGDSK